MAKKEVFEATATLIGCIIGAGVLGIPYVIAKAGLLSGILNIIGIGLAILLVHLYLGEIVLKVKGNHQLTGYAEKYLGKKAKTLMMFAMIFGIYGALIAYTMGEGAALSAIFGGSPILLSLIFFAIVSAIIFIGIKALKRSEFLITLLMLITVVIISLLSFPKLNLTNLTLFNPTANGLSNLFLFFSPYGVILFAFLGTVAIPEMKEILGKNKKAMKKAIIIGTLIPMFIYILFAIITVGVVGLEGFNSLGEDERIATIALGRLIGPMMVLFGNLFAVFAMATSFIALGTALKEMYQYDYNLNKHLAFFLTISFPLLIFLIDAFAKDITNFINALGLAGAVSGGTSGILIVLIFWKIKSKKGIILKFTKSKAMGYFLIFLLSLGILFEVASSLGLINF